MTRDGPTVTASPRQWPDSEAVGTGSVAVEEPHLQAQVADGVRRRRSGPNFGTASDDWIDLKIATVANGFSAPTRIRPPVNSRRGFRHPGRLAAGIRTRLHRHAHRTQGRSALISCEGYGAIAGRRHSEQAV